MNLKITGLNVEVTEAMRAHINSKFERINRHADDIISVTVTLSLEKVEHKAAVQIHLAGKDLHIETVEKDMYAAIDVLVDKVDRAILQHKEKSRQVR